MRGADHERAARAEVIDDRDAERAAFDRIGARADLVEQHERRALQVAIHRRDVRDVPRERAQARGNRLLVADVGEDRPEDRQRRPGSAGMCSPACAISASSPAVLSATVLPPVFGPVISSAVCGGSITMSTGTGLAGSSSTSLEYRAATVRISSGWRALMSTSRPSCAIAGAMPSMVCDKRALACSTSSSVATPVLRCRSSARSRKRVGQRQQDALDLFRLLLLERDDLVVDLNGAERLENKLAPLAELPWTMPGDAAPVLCLDEDHVAAVPLGDHLLLQVLPRVLAAQVRLERAAQPAPLLAQAIADACRAPGSRDP